MKNLFVLLLAFFATSLHASHYKQTNIMTKITLLLVYQDDTSLNHEAMLVRLSTVKFNTEVSAKLTNKSAGIQYSNKNTPNSNSAVAVLPKANPQKELTTVALPLTDTRYDLQTNKFNLKNVAYDTSNTGSQLASENDLQAYVTDNKPQVVYATHTSNSQDTSAPQSINDWTKTSKQIMF